jgi:hypothetical protein
VQFFPFGCESAMPMLPQFPHEHPLAKHADYQNNTAETTDKQYRNENDFPGGCCVFDPTIFDNVKVVLEGAVYDLDFQGRALVTGRRNVIDMAAMSREYTLRFSAKPNVGMEAEIILSAGTLDLAAELLEMDGIAPACSLTVRVHATLGGIPDPDAFCAKMRNELLDIWGDSYSIRQTLSTVHEKSDEPVSYCAEIDFNRTFTEEVIDDIPGLAEHALLSIRQADKLIHQ